MTYRLTPGWYEAASLYGIGADEVAPTVAPPHEDPAWVAPVIIIGVLGLVGAVVYTQYKVTTRIAEKEGSSGLLKYEGGKAAIGLASSWLGPRR